MAASVRTSLLSSLSTAASGSCLRRRFLRLRHRRSTGLSADSLGSRERPLDNNGTWTEKDQPLDGQLAAVVVGILVAAEVLVREQELERQRTAAKHRVWLKAEERRRRQEAEEAHRTCLLDEATAFRQAAELRAFVAAARATSVVPESGDRSTLAEWARWALSVANSLDPLIGELPDRAETG